MKLERLLGLLAISGITLLTLFLFFPARQSDEISFVDSTVKIDLDQPILPIKKDFKLSCLFCGFGTITVFVISTGFTIFLPIVCFLRSYHTLMVTSIF